MERKSMKQEERKRRIERKIPNKMLENKGDREKKEKQCRKKQNNEK